MYFKYMHRLCKLLHSMSTFDCYHWLGFSRERSSTLYLHSYGGFRTAYWKRRAGSAALLNRPVHLHRVCLPGPHVCC